MADQELTGKAGGAGEEKATGAEGAVAGAEPAVEGEQPAIAAGQEGPAEKPVDLTQSEEFRKWQAARDRREAQLRQQLQEQTRQMGEMQRRLEQVQLKDADPEEVAKYYQQQMEVLQVQQQQQAVAAQERAEIIRQAEQLLGELELDPNTPGLEWGEEPTWDGLARLAASAAKVKALQARAVTSGSQAVATEAAQTAKVEALRQAGVTKVSTATGAATSKDLRAEFEAEKAKLVGTGDVAGYARLKMKYRGLGLEV